MIVVLSFIAVCVVGAVLLGIGLARGWEEESQTFFGFLAVVGFVGVLITGIWCISVNFPVSVENEKYELAEKFKLYENEKNILLSYHKLNEGSSTELTSDITFETISTDAYYERVSSYNEKIYKFKIDVVDHKNRKANPCFNWFESAAWDTITYEMLDNLSYTTGK